MEVIKIPCLHFIKSNFTWTPIDFSFSDKIMFEMTIAHEAYNEASCYFSTSCIQNLSSGFYELKLWKSCF